MGDSKKLTENQKRNLEILRKLRRQLAEDRNERLSRLNAEERRERLNGLE